MSAPLYFLPRVSLAAFAPQQQLNRSLLEERGLAGLLGDVVSLRDDLSYFEISTAGPGGQSGLLFSVLPVISREPPRRMKFDAKDKSVEWQPWNADSSVWVGVDRQSMPTPADMERRQQYSGHVVKLADGHEWHVPVVRGPAGSTSLPQAMGYCPNKGFGMRLKVEYRDYWERSARIAELFFGPVEQRAIEFEEAFELAVMGLGINYRIGKVEASLLDLIDTTNWQDILGSMVDAQLVKKVMDTLDADPKKKETPEPTPPSPSSGPGQVGG